MATSTAGVRCQPLSNRSIRSMAAFGWSGCGRTLLAAGTFANVRHDGEKAEVGAGTVGKGGGEGEVLESALGAIDGDGDVANGPAEIRCFLTAAGGPDGGGAPTKEVGADGPIEGARRSRGDRSREK